MSVRTCGLLAGAFAILLGFGTRPSIAAEAGGPARSDFSGLVEIGGRRLYLACRGEGTPAVILEAGAGNSGDVWSEVEDPRKVSVFDGVAAFTRVCAYHRPGTVSGAGQRSRSDPVRMPRSAADVAADLRALLAAAGVRPRYVLVGHSFGGLVARLFASTAPADVAGLVLVDAAHEDFWRRLQALVTPAQWQRMQQAPLELGDHADVERLDVDASAVQMRRAAASHPLPAMPLVVVSRGLAMEIPPAMLAELSSNFAADQEKLWRELQARLAELVPGVRHVVATNSRHDIAGTEPELVIAAVRDVVEAVRRKLSMVDAR